jgi:hypothetical protein
MLKLLKSGRSRLSALAFLVAALVIGALPALAGAVETPTEEGVKKAGESVSSEGVTIIIALLSAMVALIVAVIVIPKAIGFIRRFI